MVESRKFYTKQKKIIQIYSHCQTCAESNFFKEKSTHDFDFFEKKQKIQRNFFDFFCRTSRKHFLTLSFDSKRPFS